MNFLGFLAPLLGIIMEWIYKLIPSYGWTLIIFTLLTKILMSSSRRARPGCRHISP